MKILGDENTWYLTPQPPKGVREKFLQQWMNSNDNLFGRPLSYSALEGDVCVRVSGDLDEACKVATCLELLEAMASPHLAN